MGMTIDLAVNNLSGILKEATERKDSVCYVTEDDAETLQMAIDIISKYQKIKEQVDIAIDKENFAISDARLIQIREIIDGKID